MVAYHSSARWEAEALGLASELTYCDMTTSPAGQRITVADRLAEISERYGAEHLVVRCLQRAYGHLVGTVERTEERMWAAGVRD